MKKVRLGISVGDINGVGLELIIKGFQDLSLFEYCNPILYCCKKLISKYAEKAKINPKKINFIQEENQAEENVVNCISNFKSDYDLNLGTSTKESGFIALQSLKHVSESALDGKIDCLVTCPINKETVKLHSKNFIGHTEYFENLFNGSSLMLMTSDQMKIAFLTGHIALNKVSKRINDKAIYSKIKTLHKTLQNDFLIKYPKIAVLALNPHSGENGILGHEEIEKIVPAIKRIKNENIICDGPFPADSFFSKSNLKKYDAILSMYHDQGLIPFKMCSFSSGVNFTSGLEIVRTSPVHGPAFDLTGKNMADIGSFKQSVIQACLIYKNRISLNL